MVYYFKAHNYVEQLYVCTNIIALVRAEIPKRDINFSTSFMTYEEIVLQVQHFHLISGIKLK